MVTRVAYPIAPTATARQSTLLDVAQESGSYAGADGNGLYQSYNCLTFYEAVEFCTPQAKNLDTQAPWVDGIQFGAYGGITCRAVGSDMNEMQTEVQRAFTRGESAAVERGLMELRFRVDTEAPPRWAAPTDITPASPVSPKVGLALLEDYAATIGYVGSPVIHSPVAAASIITDGAADMSGGILTSNLGSKIAVGVGYSSLNTGPDGAAAAAGSQWMYASGEVTVISGEMTTIPAFNQSTNDISVLAERPYIVAVDCFVVAVNVTIG